MSEQSAQCRDVRRFIIRAGMLAIVNIALAWAALWATGSYRSYAQWETDSILYATPRNTPFDFVSLGTSRTRIFSEFKANHDFIVNDLGLRFLNMAIPFGGGILPERLFLENFFDRGNGAKAVVLFLDPFVLFSDRLNREHRFVYYEPFRMRFMAKLIANRFPAERLMTYVRSKFGRYWFERGPLVKDRDVRVVDVAHADPAALRKRMENLYPEGLNPSNFERYSREVVRILDMAGSHGSRSFVVILPTLLGEEPGHGKTLAFLEQCRAQHPFTLCDWSKTMQEARFFADHDHLNHEGFKHMARTLLLPALGAS